MRKYERITDGINPYTLNKIDEDFTYLYQVINDQGEEILSEEGFLIWLEENGIKHREEVATFIDLPENDSLNTVRAVEDENKIYIKKENDWLPFQTIDISKINELDRKKVNKSDVVINIKDFGAVGDGVTDDAPALQAAIDSGKKIFAPSGIYNLAAPLTVRDQTEIQGCRKVLGRNQENITKFIVNGNDAFVNGEGRIDFVIDSIMIEGTGIEKGISAEFGGIIKDSLFYNLDIGINNPFGFLARYKRNFFRNCDSGIVTAESNNVLFRENHFSACVVGIDTGRNAVSTTFEENTFNLSSNSLKSIVAHGSVNIRKNYFESFGANVQEAIFIDYLFTRHGSPILNVTDNQFNGHGGAMDYFIKIDKEQDDAPTGHLNGDIAFNNFLNAAKSPVVYGTNNNIHGLRVHSNAPFTDSYNPSKIENEIIPFNPRVHARFENLHFLNGTTLSKIPVGTVLSSNFNAFEDGFVFTAPVKGTYRFSYNISIYTANSETTECEFRLIAGSMINRSFARPTMLETGNDHLTVAGTGIAELDRGNQAYIEAKGESKIRDGYITIECIDHNGTP